ncbi:MAG TPA: hypothetical protein VFM28_05700 [Nitrososphaeraceae archaeon]|jgi:hypothetical protein|nr:hypothetical protein [Nitrososphaeraceae archaeon]
MSLTNRYNNKSYHNSNLLFIIALLILSIGILFLIIGYGIYSPSKSINQISSNYGLITIPKIGHIDIIKDSRQYVI